MTIFHGFKNIGIYFSYICQQGNVFSRLYRDVIDTAQKMKFSIKDFFGRCDYIHSFLWIWSYLLKKSLTENFIFCAV